MLLYFRLPSADGRMGEVYKASDTQLEAKRRKLDGGIQKLVVSPKVIEEMLHQQGNIFIVLAQARQKP